MNTLVLLLISFIIAYTISHLFLIKAVLRKDLPIIKDFFSFIFAFSNLILLIIITEISKLEDSETRLSIWNCYIIVFLVIVFYLIPLHFFKAVIGIYSLRKLGNESKFKILIFSISYLGYLFSALVIYNSYKNINDSYLIGLSFFLSKISLLEYLGFLSIFVSAFLSAYGAVQVINTFIIIELYLKDKYKLKYDKVKKQQMNIYQMMNRNTHLIDLNKLKILEDSVSLNESYNNSSNYKSSRNSSQMTIDQLKNNSNYSVYSGAYNYYGKELESNKETNKSFFSNFSQILGYFKVKNQKEKCINEFSFDIDIEKESTSIQNTKCSNFNPYSSYNNVHQVNSDKINNNFDNNSQYNYNSNQPTTNYSSNADNNESINQELSEELLFFKKENEYLLNLIIEKNKYNKLFYEELYVNNSNNTNNNFMISTNNTIHTSSIFSLSSFFYSIQYSCTKLFGKMLALYSIYRIINTIRTLIFGDYNNVNIMLKEDVFNIIDLLIRLIINIFQTSINEMYLTLIEQYFSLMLVGSIIIINVRSFLKSIEFIYFKTLKHLENVKSFSNIYDLFLAYLVALFYITSAFFLINNLPISSRTNVAGLFGDVDFSKLKLYYDSVFVICFVGLSVLEYCSYKVYIA